MGKPKITETLRKWANPPATEEAPEAAPLTEAVPVPMSAIAATPGPPGMWLPPGSTRNGAASRTGNVAWLTPIPITPWPLTTYVETDDGLFANWNGSEWIFLDATDLYAMVIHAEPLLGYWRLNEPSGTAAADSSAAANTGAYIAAPTLGVPGIADSTAMQKTGALQQGVAITPIPAYQKLVQVAAAFTYECWFKAAVRPATSALLAMWADTPRGATPLSAAISGAGSLGITARDGVGGSLSLSDATDVCDGAWHLIDLVMDGAKARIVIDGVVKASKPYVLAAMARPTSPIKIGTGLAASETAGLACVIDEVVIYDGAQDPDKIALRHALGMKFIS